MISKIIRDSAREIKQAKSRQRISEMNLEMTEALFTAWLRAIDKEELSPLVDMLQSQIAETAEWEWRAPLSRVDVFFRQDTKSIIVRRTDGAEKVFSQHKELSK